jgi:hypothetical protein
MAFRAVGGRKGNLQVLVFKPEELDFLCGLAALREKLFPF